MWLQAIIGISVVFLALIALSFFIFLFGKIMNKEKKNGEKNSIKLSTNKKITVEVDGDDELIAVITAAVSAYLNSNGLSPECKIKVTSFNRVTSKSSIWNESSKRELVESL
ncbi:MAG: OadG family protein [Clostridiales bacterium]|nr:OadG family protein [Clostridiales bacterium]